MQSDVDRLKILVDRMQGLTEGTDFSSVVTSYDIDSVKRAINILQKEDAVNEKMKKATKQQEKLNRNALEIKRWCRRNGETLLRFADLVAVAVPECEGGKAR